MCEIEINLLDEEDEIECECGCPMEDFDIEYIDFDRELLTIPPEIDNRYELSEHIFSIKYICPDCGIKILVNNDYDC